MVPVLMLSLSLDLIHGKVSSNCRATLLRAKQLMCRISCRQGVGGVSTHSIGQLLYSCRGELHAGMGNLGQWLLDWGTQRSLFERPPTSRGHVLYVLLQL